MAAYEKFFRVCVRVDNWPDRVPAVPGIPLRTPGDYVKDALLCSALPDADRLDLFGDMEGTSAEIIDVEPEG